MKKVKIASIKKIPSKGMRYDIEVEGNCNFYANGVLVHNSSITHTQMPIEEEEEGINTLDEKFQGFNVCSRNMLLKRPVGDPNSAFWRATIENDIEKYIFNGMAIQSELIGPSIQGNPHKLDATDMRVFNIMSIAPNVPAERWSLEDMKSYCESVELQMVDIIFEGKFEDLGCETVEDFVELANKAKYKTSKGEVQAEGIVVRLCEPEPHPRMGKELSFKVISPKYALKHGE